MDAPAPLTWDGTRLHVLDQTRLPHEEVVLELRGAADTAEAIKRLAVRGAPLIGATAASAQGIEFRLGDRDRGFDRPRERVIVRERRGWDDNGVVVRRGHRDVVTTGSVGCRTTIVKRENAYGQMVTKRIRECD